MNRPLSLIALLLMGALATLPARADFSFVFVTDMHVGTTNEEGSRAAVDAQLLQEINGLAPRPAFVVNTGDLCEIGNDASYALYQKTIASLTLPHYDAPGNQDIRWEPRGKEGFVLGAKQPLYQSWDYQNVHFILLDSTIPLEHWGHLDARMLDWLRQDLSAAGERKPIIVGFHHWIGHEGAQIDNSQALLDLLRPYNVRLMLVGHGVEDLQWSLNGVPVLMAQGLFQGRYHLIQVGGGKIRVLRRTAESNRPTTEILSVPLNRPPAPGWSAKVQVVNNEGQVTVARRTLPADARLTFHFDEGEPVPMTVEGDSWTGSVSTHGLAAGRHTLTVETALADGRAYQLPVALDLSAPGAPVPAWTAPVNGPVQARLVREGDALYVATTAGELVAMDPAAGTVRWRVPTTGGIFSTPCAEDGTVYFGSANHSFTAVNSRDGSVRWRADLGAAVYAGAAKAQNVVCVAAADGKIYGLDAATGKIVWTARGEGMYQSQTATDGERFFLGGWDNYLRALDARTGQELWKNKFGRQFFFAPAIGAPTVADGKVFVPSNDGYLHAMEAATGKILWEVLGPSVGASTPLYREGRVYIGSLTETGRVFCFDAATGGKVWETPTGSVIYDSSFVFGGGNLYLSAVDGTLCAVRATDGRLLWKYRLGMGHVFASPATDDRRVYIGSLGGSVTAFPLAGVPALVSVAPQ